jgi:hypothetical protein
MPRSYLVFGDIEGIDVLRVECTKCDYRRCFETDLMLHGEVEATLLIGRYGIQAANNSCHGLS